MWFAVIFQNEAAQGVGCIKESLDRSPKHKLKYCKRDCCVRHLPQVPHNMQICRLCKCIFDDFQLANM